MTIGIARESEPSTSAPRAEISGQEATEIVERRTRRNRMLLVAPALGIIGLVGIMPLSIIVVYSFLSPGPYAGVTWTPENAALISNFARYANGISGSEAFMDPEMAEAPEIIGYDSAGTPEFIPPCPQEVVEVYTKIWNNLLK